MENRYLEKVALTTGQAVGLALGGAGALSAGIGYNAVRKGETPYKSSKKYSDFIGNTAGGAAIGLGALGGLEGFASGKGIAGKATGAIRRAAHAAVSGLVLGGTLGATLGAPRAIGTVVGHGVNAVAGHKKKASENVYIEKIASKSMTRASQTLRGKAMGLVSNQSGTGGPQQIGPGRVTNADQMAKLKLSKPTTQVGVNTSTQAVRRTGLLGLGKNEVVHTPSIATRLSGDALAAKGSGSVLASQTAKNSIGKGILGKALGFAKKNPLTTGAIALAGGIALGKASSGSQYQQQYSYPGY